MFFRLIFSEMAEQLGIQKDLANLSKLYCCEAQISLRVLRRKLMDIVRRPILQGEYKLVQVLEETDDSILYLSQSLHASERRYAVREFKIGNFEEPEQKALISSYFQPIAQRYMDFLHTGLTSLRDFFLENEYVYFVYDYIPGRRLSEFMEIRHRPLLEAQAADIALQIAETLAYLHNIKPPIFFADFNPSNILVVSNGRVMLTDYGLGRLLLKYVPEQPRMSILGYAAPEQIGPLGIVSKATDIYALGVLMHQMVTGRDPRQTPNALPPIDELNPAISNNYIQVVERATQADPKKRYLNIGDMVFQLRELVTPKGRTVKTVHHNMVKEVKNVLTHPFVGDKEA